VELRQPRCVERAEGAARRRHQVAAFDPRADVPRQPRRQSALEERAPAFDDLVAKGHAIASRKKSGPPKLPDLSASSSGGSSVTIHGTPRAISSPTPRTRMPR